LRRFILCYPFKTSKELKGEVPGFADISERTIQHMWQKRLGLPLCAAKKPLIVAKMVKKRLAFCNKTILDRKKYWDSVMFSDMSSFRLINPWVQEVRWLRAMNCTSHVMSLLTSNISPA
jgi:hypothetical protein